MTVGKLNAKQCTNHQYHPNGTGNKLSDGGGLYLHAKKSGKYWRMDYRFLKKQKTYAIGVFPEITLAEARKIRDAVRRMIRDET